MVNGTTLLPGPAALFAVRVAEKAPGVVGVPEITPVAVLMLMPGGKPLAPYSVTTGLLATTWIGVSGRPAPRLTKVGLEITGTLVGVMVKLSSAGELVANALVAVTWVVKTPLLVGVPVIWPVLVFRLRPGGKVLGANTAYDKIGRLLATT